MKYYEIKGRLVASDAPICAGVEIKKEEYDEKLAELHDKAVENAKNNPPQATDDISDTEALAIILEGE